MEVNFTLKQIDETAAAFLAEAAGYKVFAFHGDMGAGKTTFVHALCDALGVTDTISSPTFSIINEYKTEDGEPVYHMDLYRVKDENEAVNAGVEEYLYSGHICFVEWPDKAPALFPEDTLHITIISVDDITRKLKFNL
ncbi:MAG: tRNA (adenosine(37)-N6)-threonylcarbamoyltransferase complex ATPase subunit type 1 TsaE [Ferruginibacter sp.]